MDDAHKELVKRLKRTVYRSDWDDTIVYANPDGLAAADALEAMAGEVERLTTNGIHSCWEECPRLPCVQGREIRALTAERDRLKAALSKKLSAKARQKLGDFSESMIAMGGGHSLEMLLNWYDESRKALGGDAS